MPQADRTATKTVGQMLWDVFITLSQVTIGVVGFVAALFTPAFIHHFGWGAGLAFTAIGLMMFALAAKDRETQ